MVRILSKWSMFDQEICFFSQYNRSFNVLAANNSLRFFWSGVIHYLKVNSLIALRSAPGRNGQRIKEILPLLVLLDAFNFEFRVFSDMFSFIFLKDMLDNETKFIIYIFIKLQVFVSFHSSMFHLGPFLVKIYFFL